MLEKRKPFLKVLAICGGGHFLNDGSQYVLYPVSHLLIAEFSLDYAQFGLLVSGFILSASLL